MLLIFGRNGQLGNALADLAGPDAQTLDRYEADFSKPESILSILNHLKPTKVINAAAYTLVDKAESEMRLAQQINAVAPGLIADWCAEHQVPMLHYSTDYVYNGEGEAPHTESSPTSPVNTYGHTKLSGEKEIRAANPPFLIFRTSWIYDEDGKNFLNTMLRIGREHPEINVVHDQIGAPTYARHLAEASLKALDFAMQQEEFPSGIYNVCAKGETSWNGFATAIFQEARKHGEKLMVKKVLPILTEEYPTAAARPLNSRLNCEKAKNTLQIELPAWQEGLKACMTRKYARQTDIASRSETG